MKKYMVFVLCCILAQASFAQRWVDKAQKAVFSVVTYGADNKIINTGNGFFITEDGVGVSDYSLFKGADHAVVVDMSGKEMPVSLILGANDIYDLVKFRVDVKKKVETLEIAKADPGVGANVVLLPYSTKKSRTVTAGKITTETTLGGHKYYTLGMPITDQMVSCPILTDDGQVFGLAQKSAGTDKNISYAVSVSLASELTINALSLNDAALNGINIKKALPEKEEQALAMLYFAATAKSDRYVSLIDQFIEQFPKVSDGYSRRASYNVYNYFDTKHMEQIEADLNAAESNADNKANAYSSSALVVYTYALRDIKPPYKDWTMDKALGLINKAIAVDPQPVYYQQAGDINFSMKKYQEAFDSYQKVNQSKQASAVTFYYAAKAAEMLKNDTATVVALLDSAIAKYVAPYPEEASPYLWERGSIYFQKQQYKEAVTDFDAYELSVKVTPAPLFYYYREQALYRSNQFARAIVDINKAVELSPEDIDYLVEQGVVNLRISKYGDAISSLNAALKIDPKLASAYRMIGFCQIQQGKKEIGLKSLQKAIDLGDETAKNLKEKFAK